MATRIDNLDATGAKAKIVTAFPSVYEFYGETQGTEAGTQEWLGGEMIFYTPTKKIYIQTATSGITGSWYTGSLTFATTTTTSTTSTSSSTSTSTSTSSTSSSTSSSSTTTP